MSKKTKQKVGAEPFELRRVHVILGVLTVAVSAAVAIAVFTYFVGDLGGNDTLPVTVPQPSGPEQPAERSAAADLLANKSFGDMTPDEVDLVKSEAMRAFANAQFRTSSSLAPLGVDIFRINDVTRVARQYQFIASSGPAPVFTTTLLFYCDDVSGNINQYRYLENVNGVSSAPRQIKKSELPFNNTLSGLDWSKPEDLGYKTIGGHRTHGVVMPFTTPASKSSRVEVWLDVENARLMGRRSLTSDNEDDNVLRPLDWRQPQPVVIPPGQPVAPCSEAFYNLAPSARPSPSATAEAQASATSSPVP